MITEIRTAPYQATGNKDPMGIELNVVNNGDSVTLSWTNPPFFTDKTTGNNLANFVSVGKEYGTIAEPLQYKGQVPVGCPSQGLHCVPVTSGGQPVGWDGDCWSGIMDSPIAFINYQIDGVQMITIPYNRFQLAANACAFQTDGKTETYYVELFKADLMTGAMAKTKFLFDYTTPVQSFDVCGGVETVVVPPPPVTISKGRGKK